MADTVLLVDAHHHIYRAYFAIPLFKGPSGEPVNAVYGFIRMLRKWLAVYQPTHVAAVFDGGLSARRKAAWAGYKADRPRRPVDMESQVPLVRDALTAMRVCQVEIAGEEADDTIATLARASSQREAAVYVVSNDKDFAQLVGPFIRWVRADRNESVVMDEAAVTGRDGVAPELMIDFMCLVGDQVDNIPGAPGIGEKTAAALLGQYGSLENLLAKTNQISRPKLRETLETNAAQIRTNRTLVELRTDVSLPLRHEDLRRSTPDSARLTELFRLHGLKSLLADLERDSQQTPDLFSR